MEGHTIDLRALIIRDEVPDKLKLLSKLLIININVQAGFLLLELGEDVLLFIAGMGFFTFMLDIVTMAGLITFSFMLNNMIKNDDKYKSFKLLCVFLIILLIFTGFFDLPSIFFLVGLWELFLAIMIIVIMNSKEVKDHIRSRTDRYKPQPVVDVPVLTSTTEATTAPAGPREVQELPPEKKKEERPEIEGAGPKEQGANGPGEKATEGPGPGKEVGGSKGPDDGAEKKEPLQEGLIFCQACGQKNVGSAQFCNKCGKKIESVNA